MSQAIRKRTALVSVLATLILPAVAAAHPAAVHYKGKTKEGFTISLVVSRGAISQIDTILPSTCLSGQGGTPRVGQDIWEAPYKHRFPLGRDAKVTVHSWPTTHYHVKAHKRGKRIVGKLSANWSMLSTDGWGDYVIQECLATSSFNLAPR